MSEFEYETIDESGALWVPSVRKISTEHPVLGGGDEDPLNVAARDLALRTQWIRRRLEWPVRVDLAHPLIADGWQLSESRLVWVHTASGDPGRLVFPVQGVSDTTGIPSDMHFAIRGVQLYWQASTASQRTARPAVRLLHRPVNSLDAPSQVAEFAFPAQFTSYAHTRQPNFFEIPDPKPSASGAWYIECEGESGADARTGFGILDLAVEVTLTATRS